MTVLGAIPKHACNFLQGRGILPAKHTSLWNIGLMEKNGASFPG